MPLLRPAFTLQIPENRSTSVVFASPHSGRDYTWSFMRRSVLDERAIRSSEDAFVDMLFEAAPRYGAPLLAARVPRAFVDVNRSHEELDPALIEGVKRSAHNPRVASGLGVIPRVVANGKAIYRGKLSRKEADDRIGTYWRPYHEALSLLLEEAREMFGQAILIDCHSMPHEAIEGLAHPRGQRPDVVIGDRFGAAAGAEIVDRIETILMTAGIKVARNAPFAGAFVTQAYGRPSRNQHVIQLEIDRSLYMNERAIRPNGNFDAFRSLVTGVVRAISDIGRPTAALAAE